MAKKKRRINWRYAGPLFGVCALALYLIIALTVSLIAKGSGKYNIRPLGQLSGKETYKLVSAENRENPIPVKDHNYYGESLNLYFDNYSFPMTSNTLSGHTIYLKDLLSEKEYTFKIDGSAIDQQIDLSKLEDGFYSVYDVKGDQTRRLYYNGKISTNNILYTVRRNGVSHKVELIADKDYFTLADGKEFPLDQHYLYIQVSTVTGENNPTYDLAISISPSMTQHGVSLVGVEQGGVVEAEEMYRLAEEVADILEEKGMSVLLLKDSFDENILFYGTNGELNKAYDNKAKYMIHLDMNDYDDEIGVYYSSHASDEFALAIYEQMGLKTTLYEGNEAVCKQCGSEDYYDDEYEIREAGGELLGAGTYSESSMTNASFAATNSYGINTVIALMSSFTDDDVMDSWLNNRTVAAQGIAEGVLTYLQNNK